MSKKLGFTDYVYHSATVIFMKCPLAWNLCLSSTLNTHIHADMIFLDLVYITFLNSSYLSRQNLNPVVEEDYDFHPIGCNSSSRTRIGVDLDHKRISSGNDFFLKTYS